MDLATGSAGVLLALTAARDEDAEPPLPFFTGGPHPAGRGSIRPLRTEICNRLELE